MAFILVVMVLLLVGVAAARWGADSRDDAYSLGHVLRDRARTDAR